MSRLIEVTDVILARTLSDFAIEPGDSVQVGDVLARIAR